MCKQCKETLDYKKLWESSLKYIAQLEMLIKKLEARIVELERRLGLNSDNSSKPPSSDPWREPKSLRTKGKNASGGQKGHKGYTLEQVENPSSVTTHQIENCEKCGKSLSDCKVADYLKRQVFDMPRPNIEVVEHRVHTKICSCGHNNKARFPSKVSAAVQYGPRIQALAVYLSNQQLIPEDRLQQTFEDLFGLPIATATLAKMNKGFSDKIAEKQNEVLSQLKTEEVKNLDETGIRIGGKTNWLHVISNDAMTHYRVSKKRGDLLEGIQGVMVHDHWKPYFIIPNVQHALCNAHHLRELKALEEIEKEPWAFKMSRLLRILSRIKTPVLEKVFMRYNQIIANGLSFHENQEALGKRKKRTGHNLILRLTKHKDAVLRFISNPKVPFTNNQAEQDIRMMKVKQKISGGFRSSTGAENFCTIRGFLSTQRKQKNNIFDAIQLALAQ